MRAATVAVVMRVGFTGLLPPFDRQPALDPATNAAVERDDVGVAHLLQVVGRERRAEPAAAVEDERRRLVRERRLDVALDDALAQVDGAGDALLLPLVVLTRVDEHELLAILHAAQVLFDRDLADALLGV